MNKRFKKIIFNFTIMFTMVMMLTPFFWAFLSFISWENVGINILALRCNMALAFAFSTIFTLEEL